MPQLRPFAQVDVFTAQPYLGNPLAVVLDGSGLNDAQMQGFARWTNLSETTFLLPPTPEAAAQGADYRVRIFTPGGELPFAGHPTLGSCHAWLEAGGTPRAKDRIVQECAKGLVQICRDGSRLAFAAPSFQRKNPSPGLLAQVAQRLGVSVGHRHHLIARAHPHLAAHHRVQRLVGGTVAVAGVGGHVLPVDSAEYGEPDWAQGV